jgi:hypothetical protein
MGNMRVWGGAQTQKFGERGKLVLHIWRLLTLPTDFFPLIGGGKNLRSRNLPFWLTLNACRLFVDQESPVLQAGVPECRQSKMVVDPVSFLTILVVVALFHEGIE